jgi:hypothetical protein
MSAFGRKQTFPLTAYRGPSEGREKAIKIGGIMQSVIAKRLVRIT